jgi:hypothetical protein
LPSEVKCLFLHVLIICLSKGRGGRNVSILHCKSNRYNYLQFERLKYLITHVASLIDAIFLVLVAVIIEIADG